MAEGGFEVIPSHGFQAVVESHICSSPSPHLKSDVSSLQWELGLAKMQALSSPQQLNATHIPSAETSGTVSMAAPGKPLQTGQGRRQGESLAPAELPLTSLYKALGEIRGGSQADHTAWEGLKAQAAPTRGNFPSCLRRAAAVQTRVKWQFECSVVQVSGRRSVAASKLGCPPFSSPPRVHVLQFCSRCVACCSLAKGEQRLALVNWNSTEET